jgi:hypothetical protein
MPIAVGRDTLQYSMGKLIRRNQAIPVQVRRPDPEQVVIDVPGAAGAPAPQNPPDKPPPQQQAPAAGPNVTQNIFYISAPAGQQAAQQPPPPQQPQFPQEVHYHTVVHHAPRSPGRRKALSFLGSAGFVLGALACATAIWVPQAAAFTRPLAMAGLVAAGLGMLGAILLENTGKGVPLLGLVVSGIAFGLWAQKNDPRVQAEVEKLKQQVPQLDLGTSGSPKTNSPPPKTVPAAPPHKSTTNAPAAPVDTPQNDTSIFGAANGETNATPATPSQPRPVTPQATIDAATATANVEAARLAAAKRMNIDYATTKSNYDKAWANLQQAKATDAAGSDDLRAVEQKWLDAKGTLDNVCRRLRADPAVASAEAAMKSAQPAQTTSP